MILSGRHNRDYSLATLIPSKHYHLHKMWLGTGDHCARASQIMIPLPRPMPYSTTARSSNALAVHASVKVVVVRLGIGELQLRKKGLLPECSCWPKYHIFRPK